MVHQKCIPGHLPSSAVIMGLLCTIYPQLFTNVINHWDGLLRNMPEFIKSLPQSCMRRQHPTNNSLSVCLFLRLLPTRTDRALAWLPSSPIVLAASGGGGLLGRPLSLHWLVSLSFVNLIRYRLIRLLLLLNYYYYYSDNSSYFFYCISLNTHLNTPCECLSYSAINCCLKVFNFNYSL